MKMKIPLSIIAILTIMVFNSFKIQAQTQYEVRSEKELANIFWTEKTKYEDTLSNNVKQSGIIFIKFQINNNGGIDSVKFSEKNPKILLFVLTEILNKIKIVGNKVTNDNKSYILPLNYNYIPELKLPITDEQLLNQVPKIDVNDLTSYMNFDFNELFNVPESQKDLWGIQCVLLPMIKISRPVVFDKNNPWSPKSN